MHASVGLPPVTHDETRSIGHKYCGNNVVDISVGDGQNVHESARELITWQKTVRNWRKLHRSRHSPGYHIPMTEYLAARRV